VTFREFLFAWRDGTLNRDAAWRAYDILAFARLARISKHRKGVFQASALKSLKLSYAGELALPEFMARYGIEDREEAQDILGCWWLWLGLSQGRRMGVPLRAPTLADGQETASCTPPSPSLTPSR
jgi:hypothetical protein